MQTRIRLRLMRVLGVDGGQSGIRLRHSSGDRTIEAEGVSRLEGDVNASVASQAIAAWRELGSPATDRAVLGLTTAPVDKPGLDRLASLVAEGTGASEVWISDDTITAHAGALGGEWGISLRVGTGVACLAVPPDAGPPVVIDGHGYLLGDDGAGYWIGREGLRAVLRSVDGRGGYTSLSQVASERFGPLADLHVTIHDLPRAVNEIGLFAQAVLTAAVEDDRVASIVITRAAGALAETVQAAVAATGVTGDVPVVLGGRLLDRPSILRDRIVPAIQPVAPTAVVRETSGSPLDGALALGLGTIQNRYRSTIHYWKADSND